MSLLRLDRFSKVLCAVSALAVVTFIVYFANSASPREGMQLSRSWRDTAADRGPATRSSPCRFVDVTESAGVSFVHSSGERVRDIRDVMGAGVAIEDLDLDGDQDLFFVSGGGPTPTGPAPHQLYLNHGDASFELAPPSCGVADAQMGMGCAVGDVSGDGWPDLIIAGLDQTRLYLHQGLDAQKRPTFHDVAAAAGIEQQGFATAVALNDLDGDGDLDLVVVRYLTYHEPKTPSEQLDERNEPQEFVPRNFPAEPDGLYVNQGVVDGVPRFERVRDSALGEKIGKGLGVLFTDLDFDMRPDVYVANDFSPNKLFANRGGELVEIDEIAGALANDERSGMGLELGDVDGDGRPDIYAAYWQNETDALYRNEPASADPDGRFNAFFTDLAPAYGLAGPSLRRVGWGVCMADFDLDGWLDVFVGNGYTSPAIGDARRATCVPQLPSLFFCEPRPNAPHFRLAGEEAGAIVKRPLNVRGVAAGDLDGDGDVDLVLTQNQGAAIVLRNETRPVRQWLKIRLVPLTGVAEARRSPPHGIGAEVTVIAGERRLRRWVLSGESYLSHSSFEIELGLGNALEADAIDVRWPSGRESHVGPTAANQVIEIAEGR